MPKIDHLREFAPYMKKYKVVWFFLCRRKIEVGRTVNLLVILSPKMELLWILKPKVGLKILPMSRVCHHRLFLLAFSTQNQDMCHGTFGSKLIKT